MPAASVARSGIQNMPHIAPDSATAIIAQCCWLLWLISSQRYRSFESASGTGGQVLLLAFPQKQIRQKRCPLLPSFRLAQHYGSSTALLARSVFDECLGRPAFDTCCVSDRAPEAPDRAGRSTLGEDFSALCDCDHFAFSRGVFRADVQGLGSDFDTAIFA